MTDKTKNFIWVERWRPSTLDDCILDDDIKSKLVAYVQEGNIPHLFFFGNAGVGKTSVAKALANDLEMDSIFINASLDSNIDILREKVSHFARSVSRNGKKKIVILDEVDGVTSNAFFPALRPVIEQFSKNCVFIMTCNYPEKVPDPIKSRLQSFDFTIRDKKSYAKKLMTRIEEILVIENVQYEKKVLASIIKNCFPDIRKMIQNCQLNRDGLTDENVIYRLEGGDVKPLIDALKSGNASDIRKIIVEYSVLDGIYSQLYNSFKSFISPETIPNAIMITDDYMRYQSFLVDKEIHIMSYLIELSQNVKFI